LDWGINTVKTNPQDSVGRTSPSRSGKPPFPAIEVAAKVQSKAERENQESRQPCTKQATAMQDPTP